MSALTEAEIFECLSANFKLAAEHCDDLAKLPRKGPTYRKLCDELLLIEGACRQAGYWRQDARWFHFGLMMEEAHKRAGGWLRGIKGPNGVPVKLAPGHIHPLFAKLAENLRAGHAKAEEFRTKATGRVGMILPIPQTPPTRTQDRQVQVLLPPGMRSTPSGLIVPQGTAIQ